MTLQDRPQTFTADTEPLSGRNDPGEHETVAAGMILGDRYVIEALIGEGGAGRVFRAFDRVMNERVALKVLRTERAMDRSWIKRLAREVKIARAIQHPNVCRIYELGRADGHWFV